MVSTKYSTHLFSVKSLLFVDTFAQKVTSIVVLDDVVKTIGISVSYHE